MQASALGDDGVQTVRYWLYAPGKKARKWEYFYARGIMGLAWGGELGDLRAYASRSDMERQLLQTSSLRVAAPPLRSVLPGDLPGCDSHQSPMRSQGGEPGRSSSPNLEIACSHCTYRANACAYVSTRRGATNWEQPR